MLEVLRQHARVHADVSGFLVSPKENVPSKASPHGASEEDWKIFMEFAMKLSKEPKKKEGKATKSVMSMKSMKKGKKEQKAKTKANKTKKAMKSVMSGSS